MKIIMTVVLCGVLASPAYANKAIEGALPTLQRMLLASCGRIRVLTLQEPRSSVDMIIELGTANELKKLVNELGVGEDPFLVSSLELLTERQREVQQAIRNKHPDKMTIEIVY